MRSRCLSALLPILLSIGQPLIAQPLTAQSLTAQSPTVQPSAVPASVATGVSLDSIVATLQSNGFQAKLLDSQPANELILGQIVTGISGVSIMISVFKCPNSSANLACGIGFLAFFKDATNVNESALETLNASSFVKVGVQSGGNGKDGGLRVTYVYPCEGFEDPKFVPMVLKNFGSGVASVVAAYKKLQPAPAPSKSPQAKPQ
jgi:hypothetical protein